MGCKRCCFHLPLKTIAHLMACCSTSKYKGFWSGKHLKKVISDSSTNKIMEWILYLEKNKDFLPFVKQAKHDQAKHDYAS